MLRHYESLGLVRPTGRTHSGYREYSGEDIRRIFHIESLRSLGLSLRDVGRALDDPGFVPAELVDDLIRRTRDRIAAETELLTRLRRIGAAEPAGWEDVLQTVALLQALGSTDAWARQRAALSADEVFDWYVELSKTVFQAGGEPAEVSKRVLGEVLDVTLKLLHPVVPFVTETLWTTLTGGESVVIAEWPTDSGFRDPAAEQEISTLQSVITEVRRFRADQGLQPGQRVPARLALDGTALAPHEAAIRQLLRLQPEGESFTATATLPVAGAEVALDLSGTIDVAAERKRLAKDLAAAEKEKAQATAKLGNEAFLAKAPDNVVEKIRTRLAKADEDIARLQAQLDRLPAA
ncbi:class I tRNA ligase family protein [Streptomyces sp. SID2955]|nr:class I tRNA ligase family protein [Streptomyces sp. SID2955]